MCFWFGVYKGEAEFSVFWNCSLGRLSRRKIQHIHRDSRIVCLDGSCFVALASLVLIAAHSIFCIMYWCIALDGGLRLVLGWRIFTSLSSVKKLDMNAWPGRLLFRLWKYWGQAYFFGVCCPAWTRTVVGIPDDVGPGCLGLEAARSIGAGGGLKRVLTSRHYHFPVRCHN